MRSASNPSEVVSGSPSSSATLSGNPGARQHHATVLTPPISPVAEEMESVVTVKSGSKAQPRIPEVYHIQWGATAWLIALHIGALAAPWTFTWSGLAI